MPGLHPGAPCQQDHRQDAGRQGQVKMSSYHASVAGGAASKIGPKFQSMRGEKPKHSRSQIPHLRRYVYRRTLMFLRSLIARIDVLNFPGSCCG